MIAILFSWYIAAAASVPTPAADSPPAVTSTPAAVATLSQAVPIIQGTPAPFTGVLVPNDRMEHLLELSIDGKAARAGYYAVSPWYKWSMLTLSVALAGFKTYELLKK